MKRETANYLRRLLRLPPAKPKLRILPKLSVDALPARDGTAALDAARTYLKTRGIGEIKAVRSTR